MPDLSLFGPRRNSATFYFAIYWAVLDPEFEIGKGMVMAG
jgi:hypothetical protein